MLRAEQWMMVGVVLIGAYATYRLVKKNYSLEPGTPLQPGSPEDRGTVTPIYIPPGALPALPGATPQPLGNSVRLIDGNALRLTPAAWYHGRIELIDMKGKPSSFFTDAGLPLQLASMGFRNVTVFDTPQEASLDIFQAFALQNPGQKTRWFRARWPFADANGNPMPAEVARPNGLTLLWQAAPPGA